MDYREEIDKAKEYIRNNKIEEGKSILNKLIDVGIEDKEIYLELGKCYIGKEDSKAIMNIERYLELGGADINVKILLAKLYKVKGDIRKSREILESIETINKEVLIELFSINVIEGNKEKAINNIEEIDNRYQGELIEVEEIAKEYMKWREYERLEKLLINNRVNIEEEKYHYYLYRCYRETGNRDKLIKEIEYLKGKREYEKEIKEELIKESEKDIAEIGERIYKLIDIMCEYIEEDDTDSDIIKSLAILLRKNMYDKEKKRKIIDILEGYNKRSKKPRAGNIFLNEKEILEKKVVLESKPRQLIVELTTKCNLRCIMCDVRFRNQSINDNILDFIKLNIPSLERIKWQGGEVFLYDKFEELMEMCNKYDVKQVIQTNGLLINKNILDSLVSKNIHLSFSIDSVNKNLYESIRCGAKFEDLLKVVKLIHDYKKNIKDFCYTLIMVVMSNNYNEIDDMVNFAIENGFHSVTFQKYMNKGNNDLLLSKDQKKKVIEKIKFLREQYRIGKIPIQILTSIPLSDDEYINMEEELEEELIKQEIKREETKNCNDIVKEENKKEDFVCEEKLRKEDLLLDNKYNLFCVVPWTELCISASNTFQFGAGSKSFKTDNYKYNEIWNCKELVVYRSNIVKNNLSLCEKLCREREDDSNRIKLGLIM